MMLLCWSLLAAVLVRWQGESSGEVENQEYASWCAFSVGSSVTLQGTRQEGGIRTECRTVYTLVSRTAEEVILTSKSVLLLDDGQAELPAGRRIIRARISEAERRALGDPKECTCLEGHESLRVRSTLLACRWIQHLWKENGTNVSLKVWASPEIPGGVVRKSWQLSGPLQATCDSKVIAWTSQHP
jgi:hypothetical protein